MMTETEMLAIMRIKTPKLPTPEQILPGAMMVCVLDEINAPEPRHPNCEPLAVIACMWGAHGWQWYGLSDELKQAVVKAYKAHKINPREWTPIDLEISIAVVKYEVEK